MKHLYIFTLIITLTANAMAQTEEVTPSDMRYSSILPGPSSMFYQSGEEIDNRPILGTIAKKPGYTFLASAVLPGLGQAANKQWWKTGIILAIEAAAIGVYAHKKNIGRSGEREYERFADSRWSVVQYADWLVDTYKYEKDDVLNPEYQGQEEFPEATFNTAQDWKIINIDGLRELERKSIYGDTGYNFSHEMPGYGSQQYYELVSKYFQYGPGWADWNDPLGGGRMIADEAFMSDNWLEHARIGYSFNNDLGIASNMLTLLVVNHFVSAFDAYFTSMLRNSRLQATASMRNGPQLRLSYNF